MKTLTMQETEQVAGGFSVFGITGIETGLKLFSQASGVAKMATVSYSIGYGVGMGFNALWEMGTGHTPGAWLYETFGC